MKPSKINRRGFIKKTVGAVTAVSIGSQLSCTKTREPFDAKGLPTAVLGKTGVRIPRMIIGTGSRFLAVPDEDKSLEILSVALDHGLYYWDTASTYQRDEIFSEERLGKLLKHRRKEVFLATKVRERKPDGAKRIIEQSLKRLQTDHIDLLQVHSIQSVEDVDSIGARGGVLEVLDRFKSEGVCRYIGFTGHTSAEAMKAAAERYDFDTMLIALNHYKQGHERFEEHAVPAAARKGMGVLVMKVIRPRETVENLKATDLICYALSLKHVNAAVIGTDSLEVLTANLQLLRNFKPFSESEMEQMRMALAPFYRHEGLAWMNPTYQDGGLV